MAAATRSPVKRPRSDEDEFPRTVPVKINWRALLHKQLCDSTRSPLIENEDDADNIQCFYCRTEIRNPELDSSDKIFNGIGRELSGFWLDEKKERAIHESCLYALARECTCNACILLRSAIYDTLIEMTDLEQKKSNKFESAAELEALWLYTLRRYIFESAQSTLLPSNSLVDTPVSSYDVCPSTGFFNRMLEYLLAYFHFNEESDGDYMIGAIDDGAILIEIRLSLLLMDMNCEEVMSRFMKL